MKAPKENGEEFSEKEAAARFEAALKGALNTPHKPLKEKSKKAAVKKRPDSKKTG